MPEIDIWRHFEILNMDSKMTSFVLWKLLTHFFNPKINPYNMDMFGAGLKSRCQKSMSDAILQSKMATFGLWKSLETFADPRWRLMPIYSIYSSNIAWVSNDFHKPEVTILDFKMAPEIDFRHFLIVPVSGIPRLHCSCGSPSV